MFTRKLLVAEKNGQAERAGRYNSKCILPIESAGT
jgi:hypothetical protein